MTENGKMALENGSRKSTLGFAYGLRPVRVEFGGRRSPGVSPVRFGTKSKYPTPRLGSCKKVAPIRIGDLPSKDLSVLFSSKKTKTLPKSPKSRRCLYTVGEDNNQVRSEKKAAAPVKVVERSLRRPATINRASKSHIPKPSTSIKGRGSTVSSSDIKSPSLNLNQAELKNVLQEMKSVLNEQKNMVEEAKGVFSQFLQEQRINLQEMKSCVEEQKKLLEIARGSSSHKFSSAETHIVKETSLNDQENSVCHNSRRSLAAYKEMRKTFRCLGTPTLSAKKSRTRRSSLSSKVQAQLANLLDE